MANPLAVWFPTLKANTGTDIYTERLAKGLQERGIRAEISWLPHHAEYAPWLTPAPKAPDWATLVHVNTCMHPRFIPQHLPCVATIHHAVHQPNAANYKGLARSAYHKYWIAPIERRVLHQASKTIAVSQFVADTAKATLANVAMDVVYNGVDTNTFRPGKRTLQPERPFRLLYIGGWIPRKGVDLLAPIMRELGKNFELLYTGGTAAEKDKKEMPGNMHDIGRLSGDMQVAQAMRNADALLFPTRSEGFGLVAAEAMACQLPVITTNCSSLPEVVEDGVTGILCPPGNIEAFVEAARKVSQTGLETMAMEQRVKDYFSVEKSLDATIDIYYQALK